MNNLFQFLWYYFFKQFFPRKKVSDKNIVSLDEYGYRILNQIKIAKLFGLKVVFIGDSNAERSEKYKIMKLFSEVTVNGGVGGTALLDWYKFLTEGYYGKQIYEEIKDLTVIINLIGNNVLQSRMEELKYVKPLYNMFKTCYWINVPKVWYNLLPRDIKSDLKKVNDKLRKEIPESNLIDIETVTDSGQDDLPYFFVHEDIVHFSDRFDIEIRIPYILLKVYGKV